jgi:prepilin-type N-terminal cleavage/methylation domain-containing protein
MKKLLKTFTLLELLIVIAVLGIVANLIWRSEILTFEASVLDYLGVNEVGRKIFYASIASLYMYGWFKREKVEAKIKNIPLVRKSIAIFSVISIIVSAFLIFMVNSK